MTVDLILSERVRDFVERDIVRHTILAIIVFNAISLGLSTSEFVMSSVVFLLCLTELFLPSSSSNYC